MHRLAFILVLALLAGCDAGEPASTRSVDLEAPLADLTLHVGETQEIDFAEHFCDSEGAALTFEARRDSGNSVRVIPIEAGRVQLEARSEGRSIVSVTATAGDGRKANTTFAVDVLPGLCPPEPGPDQADYFPMEAGQVWQFERDLDGPPGTVGTRLSLEFESITCTGYVRTASVREVVSMEDGSVKWQVMRTFTEDSTHTLSLELPEAEENPFAVSEPSSFSRYAPVSSPDTLGLGAWYEHLRIKRGRGLVAYHRSVQIFSSHFRHLHLVRLD